jgi:hypothetical protein
VSAIEEFSGIDARTFREEIRSRYAPAVMRGLVRDWPATLAASRSIEDCRDYLLQFDRGARAEAFVGPPGIRGRFFYAPDMRSFNFERRSGRLGDVLRQLVALAGEDNPPAVYVGASPTADCLPGFSEANPMNLAGPGAMPRIWIGNRTEVSAHFDLSDNIACVVSGRRRFTVFPPEQLANLYVGPLDHTMAGQPASMVSLHEPDFERYPRYHEALAAAQAAELEPGDAIYVPALWWHHVDALSPFNVLVNYWWDDLAEHSGSPFECLAHAIWTIGNLPPERRAAWKSVFDHYVFRTGGDPVEHLAPEHRGILGAPSAGLSDRIRQFLLRGLARGGPGRPSGP